MNAGKPHAAGLHRLLPSAAEIQAVVPAREPSNEAAGDRGLLLRLRWIIDGVDSRNIYTPTQG